MWNSVVYLHSVLRRVCFTRPWVCTMPCSYRRCTASAPLSSPPSGYRWQSPSRPWARTPKLSWVTVSAGLSSSLVCTQCILPKLAGLLEEMKDPPQPPPTPLWLVLKGRLLQQCAVVQVWRCRCLTDPTRIELERSPLRYSFCMTFFCSWYIQFIVTTVEPQSFMLWGLEVL